MKPIQNISKDPIARGGVDDVKNPTFTEASERTNIASGESLPTLFGKIKKFFSDLKTVAFSGSYNDLSDKPTIPAAQVNSDWNATSGVAKINNKPTLATVATSGSYNDLSNKPTIPTVNNATLTIQKNGTNVQTFTANASSNVTCNITVPTKESDLTADRGYITSSGSCASATKATQDGSGNTITSTYVKKAGDTMSGVLTVSVSGSDTPLKIQGNSDAAVFINCTNKSGTNLGYIYGRNNSRAGYYYSGAYHDFAYYSEIPTVVSQANANALINSLSTGGSIPTDNDYYVSQYVGGGTTTTTYFRRPVSALYTYIKNKLGLGSLAYKNSLTYSDVGAAASSHTHSYLPLSGGTMTGNIKTEANLIYSTGTLKLQGQTYLNLLSPGIQCRNAGDSAWSGVSMGGATFKTGNSTAGSISVQSDTITYSEDRGNGFCIRADSGLWIRPRGTGLSFKPCAASAFNVNSSRRYKENINPLSDEEAKKILDIETVTFDYKDKEGADDRSVYNQRGVIAEQVEDIIPYAVTLEKVDDEEVPGFVDYSKFVPYLIKMCQIQQEEINELREQLMQNNS